MVRFSNVDNATTLAASVGTFTRLTVTGSANWGISATAETVYVYEGTSATAPTAFITAISSGAFSATDGPLAGTGLTAGVNAMQLANAALFSEYTGPRAGAASFAAYLPGLTNIANWSASVSNATAVPNNTAFAVTAVPEPESYALLLAGLGVVGVVSTCVRRSRA